MLSIFYGRYFQVLCKSILSQPYSTCTFSFRIRHPIMVVHLITIWSLQYHGNNYNIQIGSLSLSLSSSLSLHHIRCIQISTVYKYSFHICTHTSVLWYIYIGLHINYVHLSILHILFWPYHWGGLEVEKQTFETVVVHIYYSFPKL